MSLSAGDSSHHMGGGNESESMSSSFMSPPSSSSHRTSQGGGASSYPVPGGEWERRPPRDARQVDFNHGDETHLVRLPQHPLNAQKPLNGMWKTEPFSGKMSVLFEILFLFSLTRRTG